MWIDVRVLTRLRGLAALSQLVMCPNVFRQKPGLHWNCSIDARQRGKKDETICSVGCVNSIYTVLSLLGVYIVLFMEGKEEGPGSEAILLTFFTMMHQLNGLKLPHPDGVTFVTNYVYLTCDMIATNLFGKVHRRRRRRDQRARLARAVCPPPRKVRPRPGPAPPERRARHPTPRARSERRPQHVRHR